MNVRLRFHSKGERAFTLVELLMVIAIIAIIAALLLPGLQRAKATTRIAQCLNAKRQLTIAWSVYAEDHEGRLAANLDGDPPLLRWTGDHQSWFAEDLATNVLYLANPRYASLASYSRSREIYLCPADFHVSPRQRNAGVRRRIRNVSMNWLMGLSEKLLRWAAVDGWGGYQRTSDLEKSDPANRFLFIDEHPDSIAGAAFFLAGIRQRPSGWDNIPGSLHNGGATMSFADGHAELRRWKLDETRLPVRYWRFHGPTTQMEDFNWLWHRTGDIHP